MWASVAPVLKSLCPSAASFKDPARLGPGGEDDQGRGLRAHDVKVRDVKISPGCPVGRPVGPPVGRPVFFSVQI